MSNIFDDFPKIENGAIIDEDFSDACDSVSKSDFEKLCSDDDTDEATDIIYGDESISDSDIIDDAPVILSADEIEVDKDVPDSSLDVDIDLKYQRFIDYFLVCGNKTKAAKLAGFNAKNDDSMRVIASKAFKRAEVQAYYKLKKAELAAKADIKYDAYMSELVSIATLDIADVVESHVVANTIEGEPVYVVTFKDMADIPVYARKAVKQIKINKDGSPEMIFYDKLAALKLLGEIKGYLSTDRGNDPDSEDYGIAIIPGVLPDEG